MTSHATTLLDYIDAFAGLGEREAVIEFADEHADTLRFAALDAGSAAVARTLAESGVARGDTVAIFAEPSRAWITAAFGILRMGAVLCPLDTQFNDETLAHVLADGEAKAVFAMDAGAEAVRRAAPGVPVLDPVQAASGGAGEPDRPDISPDDRATLFYTSGTTGPPKGVPLSHANLVFQVKAVNATKLIKTTDRMLIPLPLHHVYPLVVGVISPLCIGVPVVLPRALTGPELARSLREGGVTKVIGVPRLYRALVQAVRSKAAASGALARIGFEGMFGLSGFLRRIFKVNAGKRLLGSVHKKLGPNLELVASGGSPLDPALAADLEALGWDLAQGYGLTETSPLLTLNLPGQAPLESVGHAVPGIELKVDPDRAPEGSGGSARFGELLAKGPGVFGGYLNLPEKTTEAFTDDGWFRTGDLASIGNNGLVRLHGRVSTVLVTEGGENVQPDEIEDVLDKHPYIKESGVLLHEGGLAVLVVPDAGAISGAGLDNAEHAVRGAIGETTAGMASYKRPTVVALTGRSLPRTRLGKIRRHVLGERFAEALDAAGAAAAGPMHVADMAPEDRELVESDPAGRVWEWLAERFADRELTPDTGIQLDLGVDSLEWLNLGIEISERVGVTLSEEAMGRIATVRDLLREVRDQAEGGHEVLGVDPVENPEEIFGPERLRWLEPIGPGLGLLRGVFFGLLRLIMRTYFTLRVEGLERLPVSGPYVLAPNHLSYIDPLAVVAALGRKRLGRLFWAGWRGAAYHDPFLGFFSRLGQTIPIDSDRGPASSLAAGAAVIKRGYVLGWFPEGRRSSDGALKAYKQGLGVILAKRPAMVVPVALNGTREALAPGSKMLMPAMIRVAFGEPVDSETLAAEGQGETKAERIMDALREREMNLLADMK
jgi:long-chain acyl-CoA synthetase